MLDRSFAALRTRNYRLFFIGQLISQSGTWMQRMAQAWLVLDLTGSALALGTVTALQFVPILLLTLVGGVIADRMPKRDFLLISQAVRMLQALALWVLVAGGRIELWHVYALTLLYGIAVALEQPARRAFPSELVPREHVGSAVAMNSALNNGARVIGPALGGVAIAVLGLAGCFLANAISYVAVLVALWLMRPAEFYNPREVLSGTLLQQVQEGVRYAWRTPEIAFTLLLVCALGTFGYNFNVILPLLARYTLDSGAVGFGGLNAALGLGSVLGAVVVAAQPGTSRRWVVWSGVVFALGLGLLALAPTYALMLVMLFLQGLASVAFSASANTHVQLLSPGALRGRLMALFGILFTGTTPLGATLTGAIANRWDVRAALAVDGACCLLGIALGALYLRAVVHDQAPDPTGKQV
jgi:MFS family permease